MLLTLGQRMLGRRFLSHWSMFSTFSSQFRVAFLRISRVNTFYSLKKTRKLYEERFCGRSIVSVHRANYSLEILAQEAHVG